MKPKLIEHLSSIVIVTIVMIILIHLAGEPGTRAAHRENAKLKGFSDVSFIDFNNSFHKALLHDVMNIYYPGQQSKNDSLVQFLVNFKERQFTDRLQTEFIQERLTASKFADLFGMYLKFLMVYVLVMVITYYGVQTLAVWRFVLHKRDVELIDAPVTAKRVGKKALLTIGSFILFCPSYVIAYSIRTSINTDTVPFLILLAVISNGLLIVYANKFYAFLVAENRKGYVETALVKNLSNNWHSGSSGGINWKMLCSWRKSFKGHVFDHIMMNARCQYLSTIKEQATFLITGLIIIEMALNIHGHICYEMLRQMLYKNYSIVIVIILGLFYTVKMTEIYSDYLVFRSEKKYENR